MLTDDEKSAYIDAELCLMAAPSQLDIEGTETRWDDLHWNHVVQTNFIHDTVRNTTRRDEFHLIINFL